MSVIPRLQLTLLQYEFPGILIVLFEDKVVFLGSAKKREFQKQLAWHPNQCRSRAPLSGGAHTQRDACLFECMAIPGGVNWQQ
jgi:nucleosome binding factor SPN SPT16 subunit